MKARTYTIIYARPVTRPTLSLSARCDMAPPPLRLFVLDSRSLTTGHIITTLPHESLDDIKICAGGTATHRLLVRGPASMPSDSFFAASSISDLRDSDVIVIDDTPPEAHALLRRMRAAAAAEASLRELPAVPSFLQSGASTEVDVSEAASEWHVSARSAASGDNDLAALAVQAVLGRQDDSDRGQLSARSFASGDSAAGALSSRSLPDELREERRLLEEQLSMSRRRHAALEEQRAHQEAEAHAARVTILQQAAHRRQVVPY